MRDLRVFQLQAPTWRARCRRGAADNRVKCLPLFWFGQGLTVKDPQSLSEDEEDVQHTRFYPGSGHPEVNSPTSCFDCIMNLSGVVLQCLRLRKGRKA